MHVRAAHQGSEPVVNQEESNGKLPPYVHCQESDKGFFVVTKGRSRPDSTFYFPLFYYY